MGDSYRPSTTSCNDPDVQLRTSDLIIEVLNALMFEGDYDADMRNVLEILGRAIHADRLYILEMRRRFGSAFVELCAEGVPPRLAAIARVSDAALANFVKQFRGRGVIFAETLDELVTDKSRETERAYFRKLGVHSLFSLPLYVNGRSLGCLAADNYQLDDLTHEQVTGDVLNSIDPSSQNPIPVIYQSGYLTISGYDEEFELYSLDFPNREVENVVSLASSYRTIHP